MVTRLATMVSVRFERELFTMEQHSVEEETPISSALNKASVSELF